MIGVRERAIEVENELRFWRELIGRII